MPPIKRSLVWKYFDKKSKDIVTCKVCKKDLRFSSSTTNMKSHLRCKNHSFLNFDGKAGYEHGGEIDEPLSFVDSANELAINSLKKSKEVFNYRKIVVPLTMRSVYWKCFGFPASENGVILSKIKIICLLCKTFLSYNRNTSNLRMHLQNKHAEELVQLESESPRKHTTLRKEKKIVSKKRQGNMFTSNISESIIFSNGSTLTHSHIDMSNEDYETGINLENSVIDENVSSHVNVVYGNSVTSESSSTLNRSNEGGEQNCTIESLHPFMIPVESKTVSEAVTEFIIMDMQLPEIVEGRGFQRLLATLKSPCEIPSKGNLIDEVIPRIYENFKESVQETLRNINSHISLSVEEWESNSGDSYVTFSVSYQQEKYDNLSNRVLSTVKCQQLSDSSFWEIIFDNLLEEWNLKLENMKVAVCATTQQELLNTLTKKGLVVVPCLVHTLQDVCKKVCLDQTDVHKVIVKCRMLIYNIYNNSNSLAALRIQDHLMLLEETPLVSDHKKVWLTTYNMLERVLARRQVLSTILDNIEPSAYDKNQVTLSEEEWSLIEDIISVLEPFKVTIMTLSEVRNPIVSLVKPLTSQLINSHMKHKDEDSANIKIFKSALKDVLSERYCVADVSELLNVATTLDPRFKSLPNMVEETKACLEGFIKDNLNKLIKKAPLDTRFVGETAPEKKKSRLSGMAMMLGDICSVTPSPTTMSCEERANLELAQYQSEATATLEQCPMAWWGHMAAKCPHLTCLATQYTCIPAAAVPICRIALEHQLSYMVKRANLIPEVIDRIIFLNANNSL